MQWHWGHPLHVIWGSHEKICSWHLFRYNYWDYKLRDLWRILTPHPFYKSFDLEVVFLWGTIYWVREDRHFKGIYDGCQGLSDSLNFYLMSHSVPTCLDPIRELYEAHITDDGVKILDSRVEVDRIWVTGTVLLVLFPGFGSRHHDSKVNRFPWSNDITRESKFYGKWNWSQELVSGKWELK